MTAVLEDHEIVSNLDENSQVYVYGENQQEYILDEGDFDNSELGSLICSDGFRAILVDGQYLVKDGHHHQAVVLQENDSDLTQLYINNDSCSEIFQPSNDNDSSNLEGANVDGAQVVQYIQDGADTPDGQSVIYLTDRLLDDDDDDDTQVQDEDGHIYPLKRIKMEGQMLNFEDFIQQNNVEFDGDGAGEDGEVRFELIDGADYLTYDQAAIKETNVDLSKITGKNLITGQTVTLQSYMEKLKRKMSTDSLLTDQAGNDDDNSSRPAVTEQMSNFHNLLDTKICIGKTTSGKRLVGKIIHVGRKDDRTTVTDNDVSDSPTVDDSCDDVTVSDDDNCNNHGNRTKITVKKAIVSMESFEQISRTLSGVMDMESVRKKLENKNVIVKLIEKKCNRKLNTFNKIVSYCYGYMEKDVHGFWRLIQDVDRQLALIEYYGKESVCDKRSKFPVTTSLTVLMSYDKSGRKTVRVNLNPLGRNSNCSVCGLPFTSLVNLRTHMESAHKSKSFCAICAQSFDSCQALREHRRRHMDEGRLFPCGQCGKHFNSVKKLEKHLPVHDFYVEEPLQCSLCDSKCSSQHDLNKHLLAHTGIQPYSCDVCNEHFLSQYDVNFHKRIHFPEKHFACDICMRTFSRHSNLLRHMVIHQGDGALYKCEICSCSYNYMSSLTRHMVQNHVDVRDFGTRIEKI